MATAAACAQPRQHQRSQAGPQGAESAAVTATRWHMRPLCKPVVFDVLVVVHALVAITAFASIGFGGTYAARAARHLGAAPRPGAVGGLPEPVGDQDQDEADELARYFGRPARFAPLVFAVPVLGAAAAEAKRSLRGLGQGWELAALGTALVVAVVYGRYFLPAMGHLRRALGTGAGTVADGPTTARAARAGVVASRAAAACDCLFFVALALMVWQP